MDSWRQWLWSIAKKLLFRLDAETAHHLTAIAIRAGIRVGGWPLRIASGASRSESREHPLPWVFGLEFRSRLGLAAGFDKDASLLAGLPDLGFGFAEIGTVTPRPQPGNPRPRLFRDPASLSLFNCMGFNGLGATLVSRRLAEARDRLPAGFRVGVNIGKNKDTSLEDAASDYVRAATAFQGLADYFVINVSSPNTPGLRSLQTLEALQPILEGVRGVIEGSKGALRPPLLLKLAPELEGEAFQELLVRLEGLGVQGWVLTNTWGGRRGTLSGGWSGGRLSEVSRRSLIEARAVSRLPIISVGGISSPEEALRRIECGADLVQIYSGWVFGGPGFPARISRVLRP